MTYMGLNEIREKYLEFFEDKGHLRQPAASLIPSGDASLLLINSGMAPLKPYFSGEVTPPSRRMTTCQKCIRTPDIERVGKTSRHGTFFEMLGNFSFGDYFKKEAIAWAWEFVRKVMEIPEDRLWVTVYLDDDEAEEIWKETGVRPERIRRLGKEDNFWEIGAGPCGPCSEIYYDRGEAYGCGKPDCGVGCDCDRYVEFWNLVFTQYNNDGKGNYTPLENRNIDTGMGLERLACIMQGVDNLFEVDTIRNVLLHVAELAGVGYRKDERTDISLRVVTDHIRSTTMLVCDGVMPSNEGRGYVLRRLLRRAARHGQLLGIKGSFLADVAETVIRENRGAYPELSEKHDYIMKVISMEEERFQQTIDGGMRILADRMAEEAARHSGMFSGEEAFRLYDTFGFPVDLTAEILSENGLALDLERFDKLMKDQRERARAARASMGDFAWASVDLGLDKDLRTEFLGYEQFSVEDAKILAIVVEGETAAMAGGEQEASVILDRTPFYAEMGGQVSDRGNISSGKGVLEVRHVTCLPDGKYVHTGRMVSGVLETGTRATAEINLPHRRAVMRAHSATHLLHRVLRDTLGTHVEQAGSLVEPDRLRFDFTHFAAVTPAEIETLNREINARILEDLPVTVAEMPIAEAKEAGAMALFGEKYGDMVRVVRMGDYSAELCGGTHVENTAKIGMIKIISEGSVAAGVRRIEALVGDVLRHEYELRYQILDEIAGMVKAAPLEVRQRMTLALDEVGNLRRELKKLRLRDVLSGAEQHLISGKPVDGLRVVTAMLGAADAETLRAAGDYMRDKDPSVVAVLAGSQEGKVTFLAVCGAEAVKRGIHAGNLVREVCRAGGGSGGGKAESAMGGGRDSNHVDNALALVDDFVHQHVKN